MSRMLIAVVLALLTGRSVSKPAIVCQADAGNTHALAAAEAHLAHHQAGDVQQDPKRDARHAQPTTPHGGEDQAGEQEQKCPDVKIQAALEQLLSGRTSFVIAHRLSTIRSADQVVVIDDGQIVERGDHETLLAAKGFYYDLYMSQFRREID